MNILIWLKKRSTLPIFLVATLAFIMFMILVLPQVSSYTDEITNGATSPDTAGFYSTDDLYQMIGDHGEEGRRTYVILRFTFDVFWPIVYTSFLVTGVGLLLRLIDDKRTYLIAVPIIGMMFDFLENISLSFAMLLYPTRFNFVLLISSVFSLFKWIGLIVSFGILIGFFVQYLFKLIRKQKEN